MKDVLGVQADATKSVQAVLHAVVNVQRRVASVVEKLV